MLEDARDGAVTAAPGADGHAPPVRALEPAREDGAIDAGQQLFVAGGDGVPVQVRSRVGAEVHHRDDGIEAGVLGALAHDADVAMKMQVEVVGAVGGREGIGHVEHAARDVRVAVALDAHVGPGPGRRCVVGGRIEERRLGRAELGEGGDVGLSGERREDLRPGEAGRGEELRRSHGCQRGEADEGQGGDGQARVAWRIRGERRGNSESGLGKAGFGAGSGARLRAGRRRRRAEASASILKSSSAEDRRSARERRRRAQDALVGL